MSNSLRTFDALRLMQFDALWDFWPRVQYAYMAYRTRIERSNSHCGNKIVCPAKYEQHARLISLKDMCFFCARQSWRQLQKIFNKPKNCMETIFMASEKFFIIWM